MDTHRSRNDAPDDLTRRRFLGEIGRGAVVGSVAASIIDRGQTASAADAQPGRVKHRILGKTGLKVSEIGFGGHSWAYSKVPVGEKRYRRVTLEEAVEMIAEGLDMGVNYFDSCTPLLECSVPGEALKRLKKRDQAIICVRPSHKMKGVPNDKKEVFDWTEARLKLWQTDHIDLLLLSNEQHVTDKSGYWDMSYSIEACAKLKKEGKIRFTGFGSHFTPEWFYEAFAKFAKDFDVCSMPYNVRHRVAEDVMPKAKQAGLGVVTIKPLARGSLLAKRNLQGKDAGLARDMIAFVLENKHVDVCLCGVHTREQMRENFSASWTTLSPERRTALTQRAAQLPCNEYPWLEQGWRYV
ncbi:MAG: aldo/keto reductase [Phycisphaerae bacterium]|nr:aldo/keto reductase [Phycisphaerae bacterium]